MINKLSKKLIAFLLIIISIISTVPSGVFAAPEDIAAPTTTPVSESIPSDTTHTHTDACYLESEAPHVHDGEAGSSYQISGTEYYKLNGVKYDTCPVNLSVYPYNNGGRWGFIFSTTGRETDGDLEVAQMRRYAWYYNISGNANAQQYSGLEKIEGNAIFQKCKTHTHTASCGYVNNISTTTTSHSWKTLKKMSDGNAYVSVSQTDEECIYCGLATRNYHYYCPSGTKYYTVYSTTSAYFPSPNSNDERTIDYYDSINYPSNPSLMPYNYSQRYISHSLPLCKPRITTTGAYSTCTACYRPAHTHTADCYQKIASTEHVWGDVTFNSSYDMYSIRSETKYRCIICNKEAQYIVYSNNGSKTEYDSRLSMGSCSSHDGITCVCPLSTAKTLMCDKQKGVRYAPDGSIAKPRCDTIVTNIEPNLPKHVITAGAEPYTYSTVTFADGHKETNVKCIVVSGFDEEKYNEYQTVTIGYGAFNGDIKHEGMYTTTIQVKINGYFNLSVRGNNPAMGVPTVESSKPLGTGEFAGMYLAGSTITAKSNVKAGYQAKWYNVASDKKETLECEEDDYIFKMPSTNKELIVKYSPRQYTITLDANGGEFSDKTTTKTKTVSFGQAYGELPTPKKEGYMFLGWEIEGISINRYSILNIPNDHTLVAVWNSLGEKFKYVLYDDYYGELYKPQMLGYTFKNWHEDDDTSIALATLNTPVDNGKGKIIIPTTIMTKLADHYIHANWQPNEYVVTFHTDGGEFVNTGITINGSTGVVTYHGNTAKKTVMYDMLYGTFPDVEPTDNIKDIKGNLLPKANLSFGGWYTLDKANGYGERVFETDTVELIANQDLYAMWIDDNAPKKNIKIILDANGGKFSDLSVTKTYDTFENLKYGDNLSVEKAPTRTGNTFKGWYTLKYDTPKDPEGYLIRPETTIVADPEDKSDPQIITLYAHWEREIIYDANDTDIDGNAIALEIKGTTPAQKLVNAETSVKVSNNGFTLERYVFLGWNTKKDASGQWYYTTDCLLPSGKAHYSENSYIENVTENITLYAIWDSSQALTFDARGGRVNSTIIFSNEYKYDDSVTKINDSSFVIKTKYNKTIPSAVMTPTKLGYIFKGYYTGIHGTGEIVYNAAGIYCYDAPNIELYEGRVKLNDTNKAITGTIVNSTLPENSAVQWCRIERLYAYWVFDPEYVEYPIPADGIDPYSTYSLYRYMGGDVNLEVSNTNYDTDKAIPSTEDKTISGEVSKYVLSYGICSNGDEESSTKLNYQVTIPYRLIWEDSVTEELHGFAPEDLQTITITLDDEKSVEKFLYYVSVNSLSLFEPEQLVIYKDTDKEVTQKSPVIFKDTQTVNFTHSRVLDDKNRVIGDKYTDDDNIFEIILYNSFGRIVTTEEEKEANAIFAEYSSTTKTYTDSYDKKYSKKNIIKFLSDYAGEDAVILYNKDNPTQPLSSADVTRYLNIVAKNIALYDEVETNSDELIVLSNTLLSKNTNYNTRVRLTDNYFVTSDGKTYTTEEQNNALEKINKKLLKPIKNITYQADSFEKNGNHNLGFILELKKK